jgi:site-specific DNA recombinase
MIRIAIYTRVSTQEQAESKLGLESQNALCVSAATRGRDCGSSTSVRFFSDPGVSGSVPLGRRPDGRQLVEAIESGSVDVVVALTQDRLFRGLLDTLATLQRWDELGVRLLLVDGGWYDNEDDERFMSMAMRGLFAEMERRAARKRTKRALEAARTRGTKLGGVPFGWRPAVTIADGKKLNAGVHVPVEAEQIVIERVRALRSGGIRSFRDVAAVLNREGVPAPRGGRWMAEQVRRVVSRGRV